MTSPTRIVTGPASPPQGWDVDVVLSDGGTARLRPIGPDDGPALVAFHSRLSPESIYSRFFSAHPQLTPLEVERFTNVDYDDRMALVAELDGQLIAVARYDRVPGGADAEVAFVVEDSHQGRGLATLLLEHLAAYARQHGITRFFADTLATNTRMLRVFHDAGFERDAPRYKEGVVRVTFPIEPTEAALAAIDEREWQATVRSIRRILAPRSIAVIGAGRTRGTIGHEVFRNLLAGGFAGPVYPVHPSAEFVASVRAYPSVLDIPAEVDLGVVVVPAEQVPAVVDQCGAKRVGGLVVITAGFAEMGPEGVERERALVRQAHAYGMRLVGPNCMGVVNTDSSVSMNATFAPIPPAPGRVAFSSQSGALGIAILQEATRLGLGVSTFVSVGNKADISGNDLLRYWEQDPNSDVLLLYLESFGNPRTFSRVARRVAARKPIVAVKSGRSGAGQRAASSHTAALASPDIAVDALFHQTGVIRVDTLEQFFDVAQVLVHQPLPAGRRIGIVGNAGGPGVLAADACEGAGLEVPTLSTPTQEALRSFLPVAAAVHNPVDLIASATPAQYEAAVRTVLADDAVDALIAIFIPPLVTRADDVARAIATAAADSAKPVVACFLALDGTPEPLQSGPRNIPSFRYPEEAALALARIATYAAWRARPVGRVAQLSGIDHDAARATVEAAVAAHPEGTWLDAAAIESILGAYGIARLPARRAASAAAAVEAAQAIGYPVALKAGAPAVVHKSDVGGVVLGLDAAGAVSEAFTAMAARLGDGMGGAIVQAMAPPGVETIVGVVQDPSFGPLLMFGSGGTAVELFADRAFRVLPLTDVDARELVRSTRGSALLFGYRGSPPVDVAGLEELLGRVAALAEAVPQVVEMDLNPVTVGVEGPVVVDAKIRVAPAAPPPPAGARRLR